MFSRICIIIILISFLISCAEKEQPEYTAGNSVHGKSTNSTKDQFLAYEHSIKIEATIPQIIESYKNTIELCSTSTQFDCTLLNAELNTGSYIAASIRFRVGSDGVAKLTQLATKSGLITRQSVKIEDLAKSISESKKRLEMLNNYRSRLLDIQTKANNDVDSLMKIASELARTQTQIETKAGEEAYLKQRVEKDILNISFTPVKDDSFWGTVKSSLSNIPDSFAEGLSDTIIEVSYLIPWFIIIVFMFILFRWLWYKTSTKKK